MTKRGVLLCCLLWQNFLPPGMASAAEDHKPAPMMKASAKPDKMIGIAWSHEVDEIFNDFELVYRLADSPRMALYWNREFSTDFDRRIQSIYRSVNQIEKSDSVSQELTEITVLETDNALVVLDEKTDFELESGFFKIMRQASVEMVDRESIVRLVGTTESDQDKVLNALSNYADLIVELRTHEQESEQSPVSVLVTVTDIQSARMLAKFSIDGTVEILEGETELKWIAGDSGYQRIEVDKPVVPSISPAKALGQSVALNLMKNLSMTGMN